MHPFHSSETLTIRMAVSARVRRPAIALRA